MENPQQIKDRCGSGKDQLAKMWIQSEDKDVLCDCGEVQDMEYTLVGIASPHRCILKDLWLGNNTAIDVAQYRAIKF